MRFFIETLKCRIKLSLTKALFASVFLFLVSLFFVSIAFSEQQKVKMNVGVYASNSFGQELATRFEMFAQNDVNVVRYENKENLLRDLSANKLECAYVLPESYDRSNPKINLYTTEKTIAAPIPNILFASAFLENAAGDFGYKVIKNYVSTTRSETVTEINKKNRDYLSHATFMEINYMSLKASEPVKQTNSMYLALSGTSVLFATLISMLWSLNIIKENKTMLSSRIKTSGVSIRIYRLANLIGIVLMCFAFLTLAKIMIAIFFEANVSGSFFADVCFSIFVGAFSILLADLLKIESLYLGFTLLAFLLTIFFGGIFIEIGNVANGLEFTRFLFATNYYMDVLRGSKESGVMLVCLGFACTTLYVAGLPQR